MTNQHKKYLDFILIRKSQSTIKTMGLFDYIFKSKKECEQDARVKDALNHADDVIERTERMLERMKKDDEAWKKIIGY